MYFLQEKRERENEVDVLGVCLVFGLERGGINLICGGRGFFSSPLGWLRDIRMRRCRSLV